MKMTRVASLERVPIHLKVTLSQGLLCIHMQKKYTISKLYQHVPVTSYLFRNFMLLLLVIIVFVLYAYI